MKVSTPREIAGRRIEDAKAEVTKLVERIERALAESAMDEVWIAYNDSQVARDEAMKLYRGAGWNVRYTDGAIVLKPAPIRAYPNPRD